MHSMVFSLFRIDYLSSSSVYQCKMDNSSVELDNLSVYFVALIHIVHSKQE